MDDYALSLLFTTSSADLQTAAEPSPEEDEEDPFEHTGAFSFSSLDPSLIFKPAYSDSPSPIYVKESENHVDDFSVKESDKENLDVDVSENKDHKPMNKRTTQISDRKLYESPLPSEPPDIGNWFSSYVYESPMLETSDGLALSVPGESECIKETEKDTTKIGRNNVCPKLFEQEPVSSSKVTYLSQSQFLLSEPPDVGNWFSSYEYQSPQLLDTHELGFSISEKIS